MLDGLFVTPALTAVTAALEAARASGKLAVIGHARLADALAEPPGTEPGDAREVVAVGLSARAAKKRPAALADLSSVEAGSLAGVVGVDVAVEPAWETQLAAWSRAVKDGGALVFVDRGHAAEASRRALCAGLTEIEQRRAGRLVITSGLVSHL